MLDVAVVGAGIAGLAAAWELRKAGVEVAVFEQASRAGGRICTEYVDGYAVESGAQYLLDFYERVLTLCHEVGLGDELREVMRGAGVVRDGRFYRAISPVDFAAGGLLSVRGKLGLARLAQERWSHRHDLDLFAPELAAELDDESGASYVRRVAGDEVLEFVVQPPLSAFFCWVPEHTTRGYLLAALEPSEHRIYTLARGLGTLVAALCARLDVRLGHDVRSIRRNPSGGLVLEIASGGGEQEVAARAVVCAVPAYAALGILPGLSAEQRRFFEAVQYSSALIVALGVAGRLDHTPYGYHLPRRSFRALAGVSVASAKSGRHAPDGHDLLTVVVSGAVAPQLLDRPDDVVVDAVLSELRLPGLPGDLARRVTLRRVYRHRHAAPQFDVGHLRRLAYYADGRLDGDGLFLAGDYLLGPFTEAATRTGRAAARRALKHLRR